MNPKTDEYSIALVYDRVNTIGGAEKVLQQLHKIWPKAPLYTSVWHKQSALWSKNMDVRTSFINRIPFIRTRHQWLAWAMPNVFESFTFEKYDIVISITSAEAKGIITNPETLHICYMLTPTRYLWHQAHLYQKQGFVSKNPLTNLLAPVFLSRLRVWDYMASQKPDKIVAISKTVARRIVKYYQRQVAAMIYPPVAAIKQVSTTYEEFPKPYYLLVSRLVPYKRVDVAIEAFNDNGKNLIVVGSGSGMSRLSKMAKANVRLLGRVSDAKLASLYSNCQALIFPSEEDFGIVCVEAASLGKPVVAFGQGGASETVIDGTTGVLFDKQTPESLNAAIDQLEKLELDPEEIKKQSAQFAPKKFREIFKNFVEEAWQNHQKAVV